MQWKRFLGSFGPISARPETIVSVGRFGPRFAWELALFGSWSYRRNEEDSWYAWRGCGLVIGGEGQMRDGYVSLFRLLPGSLMRSFHCSHGMTEDEGGGAGRGLEEVKTGMREAWAGL
jgi:hypothetical protein